MQYKNNLSWPEHLKYIHFGYICWGEGEGTIISETQYRKWCCVRVHKLLALAGSFD